MRYRRYKVPVVLFIFVVFYSISGYILNRQFNKELDKYENTHLFGSDYRRESTGREVAFTRVEQQRGREGDGKFEGVKQDANKVRREWEDVQNEVNKQNQMDMQQVNRQNEAELLTGNMNKDMEGEVDYGDRDVNIEDNNFRNEEIEGDVSEDEENEHMERWNEETNLNGNIKKNTHEDVILGGDLNDKTVSGKKDIHEDANKSGIENEFKQHDFNTTDIQPKLDKVKPDVKLPDLDAPGEMGKGVSIIRTALSEQEQKLYDEGWKNNSFNQYVSDMISLHRSLPDPREKDCKNTHLVHPVNELPDSSVIIIFHNEAWSTLLRTVHSVIDRSPAALLNEIILVDDFSSKEHLHKPLDDYISTLDNVKVVRAAKREGLIRARLMGAEIAQGEVLIFLDSHCEAVPGWIEFLVDPIASNWTTVTTPVIDVIDDTSFEFRMMPPHGVTVGGFSWDLMFNWHTIPQEDRKIQGDMTNPVRSPTMAGGLFAINRKYFDYLGKYDPGMEIWGGENLEISFRIWMCGGSLLVIPCSHVGHVFRKTSPYSFASANGVMSVLRKNRVRLAEVWMDEYKDAFFKSLKYNLGDYGDVSERNLLRQRLQCRSFKWYLHNVYPTMFLPEDSLARGEIRNTITGMCLDSFGRKSGQLELSKCHGEGGNQMFLYSKIGEIRTELACLDYSSGPAIMLYDCHGSQGNQMWEYNKNNTIYKPQHERCLTVTPNPWRVVLAKCEPNNSYQIWNWERKITNENKQ